MTTLDTASFLGGQDLPTTNNNTPGFFTAAMTDGNENIFERSFLADVDQRVQNVSDSGNSFFPSTTMGDFSFQPFQTSMHCSNPYLGRPDMTPPLSAKEAPADWPQHDLSEQHSTLFPHSIDTDVRPGHSRDSRLQFGQATPPDDDFPPDFFGSHEHKAQLPDDLPKLEEDDTTKSPPPLKNQKTTKRTRKSTRKPRDQEPREEQKPVDEKRHKFLERNRVAASKCRQKKKEYTQSLEDRARALDQANRSLRTSLVSHEAEYQFLLNQMLKHTDCSCTDIREFVLKKSRALTSASSSGAPSPCSTSSARLVQASSPGGNGIYGYDSASTSPAASSAMS